MSEEKQDLEDYIQYNFDGIPSFKLALFLNSGKIEVKFAFGKVEEVFFSGLSIIYQVYSEFIRGTCRIGGTNQQVSRKRGFPLG